MCWETRNSGKSVSSFQCVGDPRCFTTLGQGPRDRLASPPVLGGVGVLPGALAEQPERDQDGEGAVTLIAHQEASALEGLPCGTVAGRGGSTTKSAQRVQEQSSATEMEVSGANWRDAPAPCYFGSDVFGGEESWQDEQGGDSHADSWRNLAAEARREDSQTPTSEEESPRSSDESKVSALQSWPPTSRAGVETSAVLSNKRKERSRGQENRDAAKQRLDFPNGTTELVKILKVGLRVFAGVIRPYKGDPAWKAPQPAPRWPTPFLSARLQLGNLPPSGEQERTSN